MRAHVQDGLPEGLHHGLGKGAGLNHKEVHRVSAWSRTDCETGVSFPKKVLLNCLLTQNCTERLKSCPVSGLF